MIEEPKVFIVEWISPVITKIANRQGYWNVKVRNTEGETWITQHYKS